MSTPVEMDLVGMYHCALSFSASKGFWAEMLGVGDFYYELGVQIIEVCLATSHRNGGKHNQIPKAVRGPRL